MDLKAELQKLNEQIERFKRKRSAAVTREDPKVIAQFDREIAVATKKVASLKHQLSKEIGDKNKALKSYAFSRVITKAEQADMGKLKKSVKGLVVVHPMTAAGREMGLKEVTGYAAKKF
ncbi:YibL family ribosome-associated protein [Alginatibacterium sediminis]|uniref:YibL family ribosome-associated protein n=1 Tax=Alginatibacterium sediminis TaxID=2164068 RepID=A0A420EHN9_9ALTE|nr:YibL family ribosome-associated protein [Alginatibacterium sediminis]RKF20261.1 YibL family ribosome-associated protein [Alginatibacterium sediminis]